MAFEMDKGIVLVTELLQGGELFERSVGQEKKSKLNENRCVDEEITLYGGN